jgi:protein-tyrosine phosphatase
MTAALHSRRVSTDTRRSGPTRYRVVFVCTGNTCRSPMAEHLFRLAVGEAGLAHRVSVGSRGTRADAGAPMDPRAVRTLDLDPATVAHRAAQVDGADLAGTDLFVCMTREHRAQLAAAGADALLLTRFDASAADRADGADGADVPDPISGGLVDYRRTRAVIEAAIPGLLAHIGRAL